MFKANNGGTRTTPRMSLPQAGIKCILKKLPHPNFKNFNKALNKRILFALDRKSVSTSRNEEFVKKWVSA